MHCSDQESPGPANTSAPLPRNDSDSPDGTATREGRNFGILALYLVGGAISGVAFVLWQGWGYLGVALPFGMILGVLVYLILISLFGRYQPPLSVAEKLRAYILLALLAGVMAHFVEINFGIAIAATRTYFWVYTALLLLVGYVLPLHGHFGETVAEALGAGLAVEGVDERRTARKEKGRSRKSKGGGSRKKRRSRYVAGARSIKTPLPFLFFFWFYF